MSELSEAQRINQYHVNIEVRETRNRFGGLEPGIALQHAEHCLQGDKLRVVRQYLGGMSVGEIVVRSSLENQTVTAYLEQAKEDIARYHLASWAPEEPADFARAI